MLAERRIRCIRYIYLDRSLREYSFSLLLSATVNMYNTHSYIQRVIKQLTDPRKRTFLRIQGADLAANAFRLKLLKLFHGGVSKRELKDIWYC